VTLRTERIRTLDDIRAFLGGSEPADITPRDRATAYAFVERTLVRLRYHTGLPRAGKGPVRAFLAKVTGYSDEHRQPLRADRWRGREAREDHPASIPCGLKPRSVICYSLNIITQRIIIPS